MIANNVCCWTKGGCWSRIWVCWKGKIENYKMRGWLTFEVGRWTRWLDLSYAVVAHTRNDLTLCSITALNCIRCNWLIGRLREERAESTLKSSFAEQFPFRWFNLQQRRRGIWSWDWIKSPSYSCGASTTSVELYPLKSRNTPLLSFQIIFVKHISFN